MPARRILIETCWEHREALARNNLKAWLDKVGLPYHSPHKFRHGHIQYGVANAKNVADFKAVSMNVLHASMEITDQFYSNLADEELKRRIQGLNRNINADENKDDQINLINEFLLWKNHKGNFR